MSQQDIELLAVLTSHDSAGFTPIIDRLRKEAYRMAKAEGYDADAAEKAIKKVTDWLGSDGPFSVEYPWAYAKRIIYNTVLDYGKTHKGEKQIRLSEEDTKMLVTQVEGVSWDEGERNRRAESLGYRITKLKPTKYIEGSYTRALKRQFKEDGIEIPEPPHHWLKMLFGLQERGKWIDGSRSARQYLLDKYRGTGIKINDRAVGAFIRGNWNWRWEQYKEIKGLIDKIPGVVEQGIMEYFLRGYRVTDIAIGLFVSPEYISGVTGKWKKEWGWGKLEVEERRIILLTHCLANIYPNWQKKIKSRLHRLNYTTNIEIAKRLEEAGESIYSYSDFQLQCRLYRDRRMRNLQRILHSMVISSPEAKKFFSDLDKSEVNLNYLEGVCHCCFGWWYRKPIRCRCG